MIYNQFRPKRFSDVVGQEAVELLHHQAKQHSFAHSYLLHGASGTGKTTTARLLAMVMNCEGTNGDGEPCGKCNSCRLIQEARSWDVIEYDAATNRGIEDAKEIKTKAYYSPIGNYKVYIIDEAHGLSQPAWDCLLKLLEEPPEHLVIILCTTALDKIPITVKSRCLSCEFNPLSTVNIKLKLQTIAQTLDLELDGVADNIATMSAGNLRLAENNLEQLLPKLQRRTKAKPQQQRLWKYGIN